MQWDMMSCRRTDSQPPGTGSLEIRRTVMQHSRQSGTGIASHENGSDSPMQRNADSQAVGHKILQCERHAVIQRNRQSWLGQTVIRQNSESDTGTGSLAMGLTAMQQYRQSDTGTGSLAMGQTVMQQNRQSDTGTGSFATGQTVTCSGTDSHTLGQEVLQLDRQSCSRTDIQTLRQAVLQWDRQSCSRTDSHKFCNGTDSHTVEQTVLQIYSTVVYK
jgi:hypothetical protein